MNERISSRRELLEGLLPIARQAGAAILDIYATDFAVRGKADASPLTEADEKAEALILAALSRLAPDTPVVAEEAAACGLVRDTGGGKTFWLVDALDGTKEFVSRNGEFTVNIALIEGGVPVLGVVFAPALGRLFAGGAELGAFREDALGRRNICCRAAPEAGLTIVESRSHGHGETPTGVFGGRKIAQRLVAGSSLKFCVLAEGAADVYPRPGPTMEWDTAAGQAVLMGAGGQVRTLDGEVLVYGKPAFRNPPFVASGCA